METLKLSVRPAVLVVLWIAVSAYSISELSTVDRALRTAQASATVIAAPRPKALAGPAAFSGRPVSVR